MERVGDLYIDAWARIAHLQPQIESYLRRNMADVHMAEDLTHDSLIKAATHIDQYDPSKGTVFTWLKRIAHNTMIDHFRAASRRESEHLKTDDEFDTDINVHGHPIYVEEYHRVEEKLDAAKAVELILPKIKPTTLPIINMSAQGYSQARIAEETGIPLGTIKTRMRLARKQATLVLDPSLL